MDGNDDARAPLLVELAWSGELLNRVLAWGGNWLHLAREGGGSASCIACIRRARRATQPTWMQDNYS